MDVEELYRALEFAHYGTRLRDRILIISLSRNTPFQDLVLDFKVLTAYRIQLVVVAPDPQFELQREVALSNTHGTHFNLIQAAEPQHADDQRLTVNIQQIRAALQAGQMPIVVHHGLTPQSAHIEAMEEMVKHIGLELQAKKIVFVGQRLQEFEDTISKTRVPYDELNALCDRLDELQLRDYEPRLRYAQHLLENGIPEIAYLVGKSGRLCEEVFTHEGGGVLFSSIGESRIRQAELRDIGDITFQLRPQIDAGRILPVTENDIAQDLQNFWVYDIDGQVVAVMRIKDYGDWVEIATGTTLFRDRKFGRAGELILHLIDEARRRGKQGVFGVGIDARLEKKLIPLGFRNADPRELPQEWQKQYDFSRPSSAFLMKF
ncbi:MAG: hypothetical protein QNJ73_04270 [Gammaproteobacteria bacterium]|nr:hypothetical protein [Gammaproteobacteria bacterium]